MIEIRNFKAARRANGKVLMSESVSLLGDFPMPLSIRCGDFEIGLTVSESRAEIESALGNKISIFGPAVAIFVLVYNICTEFASRFSFPKRVV